jgi:hypothetical protein
MQINIANDGGKQVNIQSSAPITGDNPALKLQPS